MRSASYHRSAQCAPGPSSSSRRFSSCCSSRRAACTRTTPAARTRSPRASRSAGWTSGASRRTAAEQRLRDRGAREAQPPRGRHVPRQALHADPEAGARRRRHRRLGRPGPAPLALGQHLRPHLAQPARHEPERGPRPRHLLQPRRDPQAGQARQHQASTSRRSTRTSTSRRATSRRGRRPTAWPSARRACAHSCGASLLSTEGARTVRVRTKVVKPKVTTDELAEKYPAVVIVNRGAFKLTLYKNLKPAKTYGIAVGQVGLETPAGLYHVQNKAVNPAWTMPNSDWVAPGDRGKVVPGGTPAEPAQGALARASTPAPASTAPTPRARSAPPPRTAASACGSPTWSSSTTRCRSTRRSTSRSARADLLDRHLLPPLCSREA